MKKLFFLFMMSGGTISAIAQEHVLSYHKDSLLSRWVIDVNLLGGLASQTYTTANTASNYLNSVNLNTGELKYQNGYALGADAQLGFFFGKRRHWGIGTGFMYMSQHGDAVLNNYHVEFQSIDAGGNIFRQLISGNNVKEHIVTQNFGIPIVLKYKYRFSSHWGFTADAGVIINLQTIDAYTTHASFDYEAIYRLVPDEAGDTKSVYDNSPIPSADDWLITKAEFLKNNPNGNVQEYFNTKRQLGYNVGLGITPESKTGNATHTQMSVGVLLQPSFNYFLSDRATLNFGLYYMYQPLPDNAQSGYRLTDGAGKYNSVTNNVTGGNMQTYGVNIGARFFLGRNRAPLVISSIDPNQPTQCGICDGGMVLHGLPPGKQVAISYNLNGAQQSPYVTTVQASGDVKVDSLCAGNYTDIVATIKKQKAAGPTVSLIAPPISISTQNAGNPSLPATCNGTVVLGGLYAGKHVTVSYNLNGQPQPEFSGVINADGTVILPGLCEGKYTNIVVKINNCQVNGADFELIAPKPKPEPIKQEIDISTPIMFDVNKAVVHTEDYPVIERAVEVLKKDQEASVLIEGNTDASGRVSFNDKLSLKRAIAVKKELIKRGINAIRVNTKGNGSRVPADTNTTKEGKRKNRRAVMSLAHPQ